MNVTKKELFTSKISGVSTSIYKIQYGIDASKVQQMGRVHYVDILDRSGSMYQVINDVVDHTQARILTMNQNDIITVIWFSSEGDYKVVVRGASPSKGVANILESLRSTRSLTCFSDSIREAESAIDDLKSLVDCSVITLLTDGHPVTRNNYAEMNTCKDIVHRMKDSIRAFNTIGFGNYYNREFLSELSGLSSFGALRHISDIKDFTTAYKDLNDPLQQMIGSKFTVYAPDAVILYKSNDGALSSDTNELTINAQSEDNNTIYVINPTAISLEPGEEQYVLDLKEFKKAPCRGDDSYITFLYMYADFLFNKQNKRDIALDIIAKNIADRALADALTNAFSYDEIGEFNTLLQRCIKDDTDARYSAGTCPPRYVPSTTAPCVFDVLNILSGAEFCKYIPYPKDNKFVKPYERIGRKTVDEQNAFSPIPSHEIRSFIDLVYAADKLNVSMRFEVPGRVAINARAADRVGLPHIWDSKIYRTHTIIKNGNLNIPAMCVEVDEDTLEKLQAVKGLVKDLRATATENLICTLLLNKIPIINRSYAEQISADLMAKLTQHELERAIDQKVYGYLIDKGYEKITIAEKQGAFSNCTLEQIDVLKDHGISKANVYGAISPKTAVAADCDYYEIKLIETYVKGFTTLPPVEKSITKPKKTPAEQAIFDAYTRIVEQHKFSVDTLNKAQILFLEARQKDAKMDLLEIRNQMSAIKISSVLNNVWFTGVVIDEKGKAELPDNVMMNVKYAKEYIDAPPAAVV